MVTPGRFLHEIQWLRPVTAAGASGQTETTYEVAATVYGRFRTLSGHERSLAGQTGATLTHEVTLHYDPNMAPTPQWRLRYDGRDFDVKDIRNVDERNIEWRVRCVEVVR